MQAFADFILEVTYPPNPIRNLDDSLTPMQDLGHDLFFGPATDGFSNCNGCHELNPAAGFFGSDGGSSIEGEPQEFKIPHLRNMYQKIGMFGTIDVLGEDPLNTPFQGPQIRGFGFLHDGAVDTLFRFFHATVFSSTNGIGGSNVGFQTEQQRRDVEQFMLGFDTNLAPAVGQQATLSAGNAAANARMVSARTWSLEEKC